MSQQEGGVPATSTGMKWPCLACTYENWPRAATCVICHARRGRTSPDHQQALAAAATSVSSRDSPSPEGASMQRLPVDSFIQARRSQQQLEAAAAAAAGGLAENSRNSSSSCHSGASSAGLITASLASPGGGSGAGSAAAAALAAAPPWAALGLAAARLPWILHAQRQRRVLALFAFAAAAAAAI